MTKQELTAFVKKMAYDMGADMVGVAPVSRFDGQPRMLHPKAHLPTAKSVVCFGIHHPDASVEWCGEPNPNYPEAFQIGMIPKLDTMCFRIAKALEEMGYPTIAQPCTTYWRHRKYKDIPYEHAASFSHMAAFVACGLGEYGYHGMVLSPKYGPRERIIAFITSAELEPDPLYNGPALCDQCKLCAKFCIGQNYDYEKLNDPKFIEFEIEGKKFSYPNINRWRCFYGEQAHLDTTHLKDFVDMDEEKIYECIANVPRIPNQGYMCKSFKYCMTKEQRYFDKSYAPGPRRKKQKSTVSQSEIMEKIVKMAVENGAERMTVAPLSDFTHLKGNFVEGFRTDAFFNAFTTVITFGRLLHNYNDDIPLEKRNRMHVGRPTVDRMSSGLIDVTRYLDDLGYDAVQDWIYTGISAQNAQNAGWDKEGKEVYAFSVICNIPFERQTRTIRDWEDLSFPTLDKNSPTFANVDLVTVGSLDDSRYEGVAKIKEIYPNAKSIVAIAGILSETAVSLACRQEAEDGAPYAYQHYEILKECLWTGEDVCRALEKKGYFAVTLPDLAPDSFMTIGKLGRHMPDLYANAPYASVAGLGAIGKSGLIVRPDCGARLRYVFVVTDAPLTPTSRDFAPICPNDCTACAKSCPMQALSVENMKTVEIREGESYQVMVRDETRCAWSRSLAMCEGAGSGQLGWNIPDMEVPESLDEEKIGQVLNEKDKIQTLCYLCPNFTDIIIERCLQDCPLGKSK